MTFWESRSINLSSVLMSCDRRTKAAATAHTVCGAQRRNAVCLTALAVRPSCCAQLNASGRTTAVEWYQYRVTWLLVFLQTDPFCQHLPGNVPIFFHIAFLIVTKSSSNNNVGLFEFSQNATCAPCASQKTVITRSMGA